MHLMPQFRRLFVASGTHVNRLRLVHARNSVRSSSSRSASSLSFTVPERAYLEVRGKDAKSFLQGVTTNDMSLLTGHGDCVATAFLTPKGRILSDALLYDVTPPPVDEGGKVVPTIVVETHTDTHEDLARFLSMYRLRAKLKIRSAPQYHTVVVPTAQDAVPALEGAVLCALDPRHTSLGQRLLFASGEEAEPMPPSQRDVSMHSRHRILHGLGEGAELVGRVPLEANLDLLGYISFSKGCYVGQELIARTKHKGLVRKRLLPFIRTLGGGSAGAPTGSSNKAQQLDAAVVRSILTVTAVAAAPSSEAEKVGVGAPLRAGTTAVGEVAAVSIAQDMGIAKVALKAVLGDAALDGLIVESGQGHELPVELYLPQWWPEADPVTGKRLDDCSTF